MAGRTSWSCSTGNRGWSGRYSRIRYEPFRSRGNGGTGFEHRWQEKVRGRSHGRRPIGRWCAGLLGRPLWLGWWTESEME